MSHPDPCWRVGAIYRCCYRYGKDQEWCQEQLSKIREVNSEGFSNPINTNISAIWFRKNGAGVCHMDMRREAYLIGELFP